MSTMLMFNLNYSFYDKCFVLTWQVKKEFMNFVLLNDITMTVIGLSIEENTQPFSNN